MFVNQSPDTGPSLLFIEGGFTMTVFALAFALPRVGSSWFSRVEKTFSRIARKKILRSCKTTSAFFSLPIRLRWVASPTPRPRCGLTLKAYKSPCSRLICQCTFQRKVSSSPPAKCSSDTHGSVFSALPHSCAPHFAGCCRRGFRLHGHSWAEYSQCSALVSSATGSTHIPEAAPLPHWARLSFSVLSQDF